MKRFEIYRFSFLSFTIAVLLLFLLLLYSWIGSVNGLPVRSLASTDGIRWMYIHFVPNIGAAPWGEMVAGLMAAGVVWRSGLLHSLFGVLGWNSVRVTLKQLRALSLSIMVLILAFTVLLLLVLPPATVLLSPFGTLAHSPFLRGLFGALCCVVLAVGNVFGLTSGTFSTVDDTIRANTYLLRSLLPQMPAIVVVAQLVACADYVLLFHAGHSVAPIVSSLMYVAIVASTLVGNTSD